jgi:hypothetical protein
MTRNQTADRALRFLHLPKTAGTSVNVLLDRIYPLSSIWGFRDSVSLEDNLHRLRSLDPEKRRAIRLFRGHAPLMTGEADVDGARVFTLLRDPVQRVKSFCCHVAEGKSPDLRDAFPPGKFDLEAFLDCGHAELVDLQTRMLLGQERYESLRAEGDEGAFRTALEEVYDRFDLVGVQERYEETLLVAMLVFGWPLTNPRKRLNARGLDNPVRFTEASIAKIGRMNRWDGLAHRIAGERFAKTCNSFGIRLPWLKLRLSCQRRAAGLKGRLASFRSSRDG